MRMYTLIYVYVYLNINTYIHTHHLNKHPFLSLLVIKFSLKYIFHQIFFEIFIFIFGYLFTDSLSLPEYVFHEIRAGIMNFIMYFPSF